MSRKKLLVITLGAVALVAAVVAFVVLSRAPDRFIYGLQPVSPNEAVLLTRRNDDTSRFFVAFVRSDGTLVWDTETTPFEAADALGYSGIAADAGQIFLIGQRDADIVVLALDRANGDIRWETVVAKGVRMERIGPSLLADAGRVIAIHTNAPAAPGADDPTLTETMTALAADTGARVWPVDAAESPAPLNPRTVVATGPGRLVWASLDGRSDDSGSFVDNGIELDVVTGERRQQLPVFWDACMTPSGLIAFGLDETSFIPTAEAGLGQPRALVRSGTWRIGGVGAPCGVHGGLAILGMAPGLPAKDAPESRVLVAVDLATSQVRWTRTFDGRHAYGYFRATGGELPRMLPVVTIGEDREAGRTTWFVAVVDLTTGEIRAETPSAGHPNTLATPERAVIHDTAQGTLVSVDPFSGRLSAPVHIIGGGWRDIQAEDFRFGRLWLAADTWAGPSELPWGVIDVAAWRVVHTHGDFKLPGFEAPAR
jgi:hypothetical protein